MEDVPHFLILPVLRIESIAMLPPAVGRVRVSLFGSYDRRMGIPARRERFEAASGRNVQPTNHRKVAELC